MPMVTLQARQAQQMAEIGFTEAPLEPWFKTSALSGELFIYHEKENMTLSSWYSGSHGA